MSDGSSDAILVLVCGLPAAGKTTLVKHLVTTCNTSSTRLYQGISLDDLYEQQSENGDTRSTEFDPSTWKTCQKEIVLRVAKCIKDYMSTRCSESTHQLVMLIDDNFQYRSQRKRFFHVATNGTVFLFSLRVGTPTVAYMSLLMCSELRIWLAVREHPRSNVPRTKC